MSHLWNAYYRIFNHHIFQKLIWLNYEYPCVPGSGEMNMLYHTWALPNIIPGVFVRLFTICVFKNPLTLTPSHSSSLPTTITRTT